MKFSDKTDEELAATIRLGAEVQGFVEGEFFKSRLKLEIERNREIAKQNGDWHPGSTFDPVAISLTTSYNSGIREGLRLLEASLGKLIQDAKEAAKESKFRQEKTKK